MGGKAKKEIKAIDKIFEEIKKECKYHCICSDTKSNSNIEVCFFISVLVFKLNTSSSIYFCPYNLISNFNIGDDIINISLIKFNFLINTNDKDSDFVTFLSKLGNNYQSIEIDKEEVNGIKDKGCAIFGESIAASNIHMDNDSLYSYFNLEKIKYSWFVKWFIGCALFAIIPINIIYYIINIFDHLDSGFYLPGTVIPIILCSILLYKDFIKFIINAILKKFGIVSGKVLFLEDTIILNIQSSISSIAYKDIAFFAKDNSYYYIRFKKTPPLMINIIELPEKDSKLLNHIIKKRNG